MEKNETSISQESLALVRRFLLVRNTASHPQALEGSRFVARQLYGLAAGGSRERLEVRQFYGPLHPDTQ
jgi:hypothetical protein